MRQEPSTPYIFIRYERKDGILDDGTRPFPPAAKVTFYQCTGILVNGAPYDGIALNPGTPYQLSALVVNRGAIPARVTVRFYPSEPATGMDVTKLLPEAKESLRQQQTSIRPTVSDRS
jgi:hypothetical protein